jgi:hypothetical protein
VNISDMDTRRRIGIAICAAIVAVGLGDLLRPGCGDEVPAVPFPDGETPSVTYALTPYDFGALLKAGDAPPTTQIAAVPKTGFPDAPVLTRAETPADWVMPGTREALSLNRLPGGWTQVRWGNSETRSSGPLSLRSAKVTLKRDGSPSRCTRVGIDRFRCSDAGWGFVGPNTLTVSGRKERCIWAHPLRGATTLVSYGEADPAAIEDLKIWTALDDGVAEAGGPVEVTVTWGEARTEIRHPPTQGWQRTTVNKPPAPASFEVRIRANQVGQRHFCYRLPTGGQR